VQKELSGPQWVSRFPSSVKVENLTTPFQSGVTRFLAALDRAGASVRINATLRPAERAYLMHYSFQIAHGLNPVEVPSSNEVAIEWVHQTSCQSVEAARQMASGYSVVYRPALNSRHTEGKAIDMSISWQKALAIVDANGRTITIAGPGTQNNRQLWSVGASFGVIKNQADLPHWSVDGH